MLPFGAVIRNHPQPRRPRRVTGSGHVILTCWLYSRQSEAAEGEKRGMSGEVIATVLTGAGVLIGVWRMVEGVRLDLAGRIAAVDRRVDAVNTRIDNILLADRKV